MSGDDGQYSFPSIPPGPFQLTVSAASFATRTFSGTLHPGEVVLLPPIEIAVAPNVTKVVVLPQEEQAKVELKAEEKQRVLGVIPNFYVTYIPNAAPLSSKQKFQLAWKSTIDPVNIVIDRGYRGTGASRQSLQRIRAGRSRLRKAFRGCLRRFSDRHVPWRCRISVSVQTGSAIFLQGDGSNRSRLGYALANAVICKGDNGHWQMNYSYLLGDLAASGISNTYYPAEESRGWIDVRKCGDRCGRNRSRKRAAGIPDPQADQESRRRKVLKLTAEISGRDASPSRYARAEEPAEFRIFW